MNQRPIDPRLTLRLGNIANQPDCDCIMNSANTNLRMGSGVSGAIHQTAGPELEAYCVQYRPLKLVDAIISPGFNLPNRWVIHVKAPHYDSDPEPEQALARAIVEVLRLAELGACAKLAIPALSTGVYRFPMDKAAEILVRTIDRCLTSSESQLTEARIVLANQVALDVFKRVVARRVEGTDGLPRE